MKQLTRVVPTIGAYCGGVIIGIVASKQVYQNALTHPHQIAALAIIQHNATVLGIMFLGIITLGIVTLGVLFLNGALLGLTLGVYTLRGKLFPLLFALAPHGILEVGAFLLAGYADWFLVTELWQCIRSPNKERWRQQQPMIQRCLLFNVIALVMLIVAGYIEHTLFLTV
jgi:stage II sporulation protein M